LAYARGDGLDDRLWLRFTRALGYPAEQAHLDRLREGTAADYLLQTVADGAGRVTRLFHQALTDELVSRRDQAADERDLLSALRAFAAETRWANAPQYLREHSAEHAAAAGKIDDL